MKKDPPIYDWLLLNRPSNIMIHNDKQGFFFRCTECGATADSLYGVNHYPNCWEGKVDTYLRDRGYVWTQEELDEAKNRAKDLQDKIKWE